MHASIVLSSALFAVAMAQEYGNAPPPPPPAYGAPSVTVLPEAYSTYLPEATTLCVDSTSTITVTCPTTVTLTRMQTYSWSEYTTSSCETPEETETAAPVETPSETPCPANSTLAYAPTPSAVPYGPGSGNETQSSPQPAATTGFVSGAGRSGVASAAMVIVVGVAAAFL